MTGESQAQLTDMIGVDNAHWWNIPPHARSRSTNEWDYAILQNPEPSMLMGCI